MTAHDLEYVRQQLTIATADLSTQTKGQMQAWQEHAQFATGAVKRKKRQQRDEATGNMMTLETPVISAKPSRAKSGHTPLVKPTAFATASWRRAMMPLDAHQKAWLLWIYSGSSAWEHQVTLTQWAWTQFSLQLAGKRVAKKTLERLRQLIWLAAQNEKAMLAGLDAYQYNVLAGLVGVKPDNWSKNYADYWLAMCEIFQTLDYEALLRVVKTRSQQKATFSQLGIANINR